MKATKISNHWLLEADGFLTENEEKTIEEKRKMCYDKRRKIREERK